MIDLVLSDAGSRLFSVFEAAVGVEFVGRDTLALC